MKSLLFLIASLAAAQTVTLSPQGPVAAGKTVSVPLNLSGTGTNNIVGVQFTVTFSVAVTNLNFTAGATATAAGKTISCFTNGNVSTCIISGMNATVLADGTVANIGFTMPTSAVTLTMSNSLSASSAGLGVPLAAGSPLSLSLPSPCDVNQDGLVNSSDYTAAVNQGDGAAPGVTADVNGDKVVNIIDVARIGIAAGGGSCITGP